MHVAPASVHALLGENGAGKTTLMRIAFGMLRPQSGVITITGSVRDLASPADAIAHGIAMVHQHFTIVPSMTVADHVALGGHGRYDARTARERVLAVGRDTGLVLDPDARAESLPVGALQRLEIIKAFATGARVLILDEPTAVLAPSETDDLLRTLRRFADGGGSVIIITHKLREALTGADSVTVLRRGRTVLEGAIASTTERDLAEAMLGQAPSVAPRSVKSQARAGASIVIDAQNVHIRDAHGVERVRGATLALHAGEIVGLAAVEG
ncbi:MAG: ATP-binding cassette domain-containing protein, partial [Gemmatimonadota bacterium]|nr:ATP-binding cassette domain-containing protein [Gemmatimonadota bacterium]